MIFFDYIFYRIYLFYKKKDYIPIMMGIYFVLVLQVCFTFFIGIVVNISTSGVFSAKSKYFGETTLWIGYSAIQIFLFGFDVYRYSKKNNVNNLILKFKSIGLNGKIKTWQIFILPLIVLCLAFAVILVHKRIS